MVNPDSTIAPVTKAQMGWVRSLWLGYKKARWGWHVAVPLGLGGVAGSLLGWAWTMLDQQEYAAAMILVFFFLVLGIGAAIAITKRIIRAIALASVIAITAFSGLKVWFERGDKGWTTLFGGAKADIDSSPLRPAQDPIAMNPCNAISERDMPKDALMVIFGNQVAVTSGSGRVVILRLGGEDMLSFIRGPNGGILLNAIVRDRDFNEIATVTANRVVMKSRENYYAERDPHTFFIVDPSGGRALYVRYLNQSAMHVAGNFFRAGSNPVSVQGGIQTSDFRYFSNNCFVVPPRTALFDLD